MSGHPDYTKPVTIVGYTIASLPIDIVAQTVGNIGIDIVAQSVGNIGVDIKAVTATLNVNIQTCAATLNVNITAGIVDSRVSQGFVNPDWEYDFQGWSRFQGPWEITTERAWFGAKSIRLTTGKTGSVLQTCNPFIPVDNIEALTIAMEADNIADVVGVYLWYADGSGDETLLKCTSPFTWEVFNLNKTAGKFITEIDIYAMAAVVGAFVDVDMVALSWKSAVRTNIVASVTLNVSISASTVTLDVNIKSQTANINVDIKAQSVDFNIKTSGGVNLVVDKLTQTAYIERRSTLSNNGAAATWVAVSGAERWGKFFPRGARGFINTIDVYCKDASVLGGTITVYVSPHPSMGAIASATITVPGAGSADWRSATFNRMWNYDSLFIMAVCSIASLNMAADSEANPDGFYSIDSGATWVHEDWRYWFRAVMKGETVGDLPVSGTINTVEIPQASTQSVYENVDLPKGTELDIITINGAGSVDFLSARVNAATNSDDVAVKVYCDGILALEMQFVTMSYRGYTVTTFPIALLQFGGNASCMVDIMKKFSFRRQFRLAMKETVGTTDQVVHAWVYPSVIC